jgi:hypothetical protein
MQKSFLERFIQKYNLSGASENVELVMQNGILKTAFVGDDGNCVGNISTQSIPLDDGKYRIMYTGTLLKLLSVLDETITITTKVVKGKTVAFNLSDSRNKATFALADLTPTVPVLNSLPTWDIEIAIDSELMASYIKAKSALNDIDVVTVVADGKSTQLVLGHNSNSNTNSFAISCTSTTSPTLRPINFSSRYIREIFMANREAKGGKMEVSDLGIMHIAFDVDDFTAEYWIMERE